MRIGIDIMGGDYAPLEIIKGSIKAGYEINPDFKIVLFGDESVIIKTFADLNAKIDNFEIVNCSETILMGDDPVKSFISKSDSSITKGFHYLKQGKIDGFASAGNTGAMLVGATTVIGVVPGILRPTIASVYPNLQGGMNLILDVGINSDTKPEVLYQFAKIGSIYFEKVYNKKNAKVGLLNIGEEESKGNILAKSAYKILKDSTEFNFIGNVEGSNFNDSDKADIIVTDGFTGNIVLKQAEAFYKTVKLRNIQDEYFENFNYENYGGTPILGINKTVVVGHGISNSIAIKNMILHTFEICKSQLPESITKNFNHDKN
jgi:phosphate acyltransferase